jgi:hypothetical protein
MDPRIKPDIFKQKVACADCPFRREGGVRHTPEMAASYMAHFLTRPGSTFPCHKSVPKDDTREAWSEWQDGQVLCAGGLIFAAKHGAKNDLVRFAEHAGWYRPDQHPPEAFAEVFDSIPEMMLAADWEKKDEP